MTASICCSRRNENDGSSGSSFVPPSPRYEVLRKLKVQNYSDREHHHHQQQRRVRSAANTCKAAAVVAGRWSPNRSPKPKVGTLTRPPLATLTIPAPHLCRTPSDSNISLVSAITFDATVAESSISTDTRTTQRSTNSQQQHSVAHEGTKFRKPASASAVNDSEIYFDSEDDGTDDGEEETLANMTTSTATTTAAATSDGEQEQRDEASLASNWGSTKFRQRDIFFDSHNAVCGFLNSSHANVNGADGEKQQQDGGYMMYKNAGNNEDLVLLQEDDGEDDSDSDSTASDDDEETEVFSFHRRDSSTLDGMASLAREDVTFRKVTTKQQRKPTVTTTTTTTITTTAEHCEIVFHPY